MHKFKYMVMVVLLVLGGLAMIAAIGAYLEWLFWAGIVAYVIGLLLFLFDRDDGT